MPFHSGIHLHAGSDSFAFPVSTAIPTSVLVYDFVAENTCCAVSGPVPWKYHSPASFPSLATTRQFDFPTSAVRAIASSFAASRPTEAGETFGHGPLGVSVDRADPEVAAEPDDADRADEPSLEHATSSVDTATTTIAIGSVRPPTQRTVVRRIGGGGTSVRAAAGEQIERVRAGPGGRPRAPRPHRPRRRGVDIRQAPIEPATARDSMPKPRPPSSLTRRIASTSPGASRSITARVPSGVRSRGPKPVPPVVTTSPTKSRVRVRSACAT